MSLWNPKTPLNQPPHFGRLNSQPIHVRPTAEEIADRVVQAAQFERITQTQRLGGRAVVGA